MIKASHQNVAQLAKRILHLPIRWADWWRCRWHEAQDVPEYKWGQPW